MFQPGDGEVLKLGPPCAGEVTIKVDPQHTGGSVAVGTETLLPGAEIPMHRHLQEEEILFVHKGQGRAIVNEQSMTVVPGMMVYVPRQAWHSLRNTGTGTLQITWTSAPPGLERFFRELSGAGPAVDAAAMQEIARRHGIEFRPAGSSPQPAPSQTGHRHRHHRRGRGGGRGANPPIRSAQPVQSVPPPSAAPAPSAISSSALAAERAPAPLKGQPSHAPPGGPPRHRRRHRGRGRGTGTSTPAPASPAQPPVAAPKPSTPRPQPERPRGRSRRRVKEVYMGGKWIKVEGEGPVISTD